MAQRRPYNNRQSHRPPRPAGPPMEPPKVRVPTPIKQYGQPFVLMEDDTKRTYEYQAGSWVSYGRSIAECRIDCQVKELAQKVNKMTRYEIRPEISQG